MRLRTIALSSCLACFLPERVVLGFASAASVGVKMSSALSSLRTEKGSRGSRRTIASGDAVGVLPAEAWPAEAARAASRAAGRSGVTVSKKWHCGGIGTVSFRCEYGCGCGYEVHAVLVIGGGVQGLVLCDSVGRTSCWVQWGTGVHGTAAGGESL